MKSLRLLFIFVMIVVFVGGLAWIANYFAGISLWYVYSLVGTDMAVFYAVFPYFRHRKDN